MRIIITFQSGLTTEALVVALGREQMRALIPGQPDAITFYKHYGSWCTESGESIELDAVMAVEGVNYSAITEEIAPQTMVAGN